MMPPQSVVIDGVRRTRVTLTLWRKDPLAIFLPWALGSALTAVLLLISVWIVAHLQTPDPTLMGLPHGDIPAALRVLLRNSLVLALHAMACVAGFIAGSSLPLEAQHYNRYWQTVHDHAGRFAILFVIAATMFSLVTQALILGQGASTLAAQMDLSETRLLLTVLPHALPELFALFLPLAAWTIASRRGQWDQLMAATVVTVAIAVPLLIASSLIEVYLWPRLVFDAAGIAWPT